MSVNDSYRFMLTLRASRVSLLIDSINKLLRNRGLTSEVTFKVCIITKLISEWERGWRTGGRRGGKRGGKRGGRSSATAVVLLLLFARVFVISNRNDTPVYHLLKSEPYKASGV